MLNVLDFSFLLDESIMEWGRRKVMPNQGIIRSYNRFCLNWLTDYSKDNETV